MLARENACQHDRNNSLQEHIKSKIIPVAKKSETLLVEEHIIPNEKELSGVILQLQAISFLLQVNTNVDGDYVLCAVPKSRFLHIMKHLTDDEEFLSPFGIRSLSKVHVYIILFPSSVQQNQLFKVNFMRIYGILSKCIDLDHDQRDQ